jgi:tRNA-2-methylthio-N6-dimethylallyladenosine synthase
MGLSTDVIAGFCTESVEEHEETLSLMELVKFDHAYMFMYSERPGTPAARKLEDNVSEEEKNRRLQEIIALQNRHSLESNKRDLGKVFKVLVEGFSKRSDEMLKGRNDQNKMIVFPKQDFKKGDFALVKINDCTSATLIGEAVGEV